MNARRTRRYTNLDPLHRPHSTLELFRWGVFDRILGRRRVAPAGPPAIRVEPRLDLVLATDGGSRLTWIGHASFLATLGATSLWIDPVFSAHAGWLFRRHVAPGLDLKQIPRPRAVLITHSHYDHLDALTFRHLPRNTPVFAPAGLGPWFARRGYRDVTEMNWWDPARIDDLQVTFVPARHWTRRRLRDTNQSHWGGYVIEGGGTSVYHAGDSGWFDGFAEIGRRFPGLDVALLPIGAYAPAWFMEPHHMNPEQAGRAFLALGARTLVPMHWGTFQLTDEPLREPVQRLRAWWSEQSAPDGMELQVLDVGQTLALDRREVRAADPAAATAHGGAVGRGHHPAPTEPRS